jgi:hypothetical protein
VFTTWPGLTITRSPGLALLLGIKFRQGPNVAFGSLFKISTIVEIVQSQ